MKRKVEYQVESKYPDESEWHEEAVLPDITQAIQIAENMPDIDGTSAKVRIKRISTEIELVPKYLWKFDDGEA